MKEIKPGLNKHELVLIHKQNKRPETGFYLQKNTEIKIRFVNSISADCHDA